MSQTILFFGNERLATGVATSAQTLQALLAAGYRVPTVIVAQQENGKSRNSRGLEIAEVAAGSGIPVLAPHKVSEAKDQLASYGAEAAVLVAYGKIVPQSIIDLFPCGIINIHPSLLPLHRGPTPLESAILDGDKETGVSLMALSAKMDAGPVYAQERVALSGDESKQQLADHLLAVGGAMLIRSLPAILDGSLPPAVQAENEATYDQLIKKDSAVITQTDWGEPAERFMRKLRAYAGWPRLRTVIGTTGVIITAAHVEPGSGVPGTLWLEAKQLGIHTSNGIFIIDSLIPDGKKEMSGSAFLAGYRP